MPAMPLSYLYTFFAIIAVSSLLLAAFIDYTGAIRFAAETRKLKNLMDYVAAKAAELITLAAATNSSAETFIQAPPTIGETQYWLRLQNDSSKTWLEGGFGNVPTEETELYVYLPGKASASGDYVSGYGAIRLACLTSLNTPCLKLSSLSLKGG